MLAARTGLLLAAGLSLCGCVQAKLVEGSPIAKEHVERLEVGVTTKQQVLDWFGAPQSFTDLDVLHRLIQETGHVPQDVLEAPYADVLVFQLTQAEVDGFILVLYSQFDVRVSTDRLIVFFDKNDRVLAWGMAEGIEEKPDASD
jgi:hypothetical protein